MRKSGDYVTRSKGSRLAILVDAAGAVALFLLLFAVLHMPIAA